MKLEGAFAVQEYVDRKKQLPFVLWNLYRKEQAMDLEQKQAVFKTLC